MAAGNNTAADYSDWMKSLPESLHSIPLNHLAIPGTHDSFTFHLDESGSVATGAPGAVQGLATVFGSLAKKIISNWSKTQSLGVDAQLKAGVRYFDIRVSGRPGSSELFIVHGLYGPTVESCMESLATFLDEHCCEIVLLDFNHFYDMDSAAHDRLIKALIDRFSSKMCPVMDMSELTLEMMWSAGLQLIVFYHCDAACQRHFQLWPGACIPAPWHETFSCPALLSAVDRELSTRQTSCTSFHVMQGVFTPDSGFIVSHLGQKLLDTLAGQALDSFLDWLRYQKCGPGGINIVTVDFVELTQLVPILLRMNQTMADCLTVTGSSS